MDSHIEFKMGEETCSRGGKGILVISKITNIQNPELMRVWLLCLHCGGRSAPLRLEGKIRDDVLNAVNDFRNRHQPIARPFNTPQCPYCGVEHPIHVNSGLLTVLFEHDRIVFTGRCRVPNCRREISGYSPQDVEVHYMLEKLGFKF